MTSRGRRARTGADDDDTGNDDTARTIPSRDVLEAQLDHDEPTRAIPLRSGRRARRDLDETTMAIPLRHTGTASGPSSTAGPAAASDTGGLSRRELHRPARRPAGVLRRRSARLVRGGPPRLPVRRIRRVTVLAAGGVLVLGAGGVAVAPHLGLTAAPEVTATVRSVPGPAALGAAQPTSPTTAAAVRRLGSPIAITPRRAVTSTPKLAWAPPPLTDPLTETVAPGHRSLKLDPNRDYTVVLPRTPVDLGGGVTITGGRNVVIIGGIIQIRSGGKALSEHDRRGLYLKGQTGTIHVEGVHMTGDLSDGFNLAEDAGAVVQIENVTIDLVHGGKDAHHADVLQTWAGPRVLRVDGLRAATEYQGFFLLPNQFGSAGTPQSFVFRRTVLTMMPDCGYAVWLPEARPTWMDWSGITVRVGDGVDTGKLSWPDAGLGLKVVGEDAAVDLPAGTPGGSYVSPGYAQKP